LPDNLEQGYFRGAKQILLKKRQGLLQRLGLLVLGQRILGEGRGVGSGVGTGVGSGVGSREGSGVGSLSPKETVAHPSPISTTRTVP